MFRVAVSLALFSLTLFPFAAAACTEGTVLVTARPVLSLAPSPTGEDLYIAQRVEDPGAPLRVAIELRHGADLFSRQLYVADSAVSNLRADDANVYFVQPDEHRVVRLSRDGGSPVVLASAIGITALELDGDYAYWISSPYTTPDGVSHPAQIARVRKSGGPAEVIVESEQLLLPWLEFDDENIYYAVRESATRSSIFSYSKTTGLKSRIHEVDGLVAVSLWNGWLYEALPQHIQRIPVQGGEIEPIADFAFPGGSFGGSFAEILVVGGQVVARQVYAVGRGCINDSLALYSPGAEPRLLSNRAGDFARSGATILHAPKDCFLFGERPPFGIERFCLAQPRRRAVN